MTVSRSTHVASNDSILFLFMAGVIFNCIYVKVIVKVFVAQSFLTLCDPMDCSLPGPSVRGIPQARILELVAISYSRSSWPKSWDGSHVSSVSSTSTTREVPLNVYHCLVCSLCLFSIVVNWVMVPQRCPCLSPVEPMNTSAYMVKGTLQMWLN